MFSKNSAKLIQSLQLKKNRIALNLMVIEGEKLIIEAIQQQAEIKSIFILNDVYENYKSVFENTNFTIVTPVQLQQISNLKNNNFGVATVVFNPKDLDYSLILNKKVLILEDINDPGNLGTIIRTADWYGIKNIICSSDCVDYTNPKVIQSTMGSVFNVNIFYKDLNEVYDKLEKIPNFPIYASMLRGENFREVSVLKQGALIMGSESHGIKTFPSNYKAITIPKNMNAKAESLNVAMACAILSERIWQH
jgi:TrmH family RNA methyltransferase